MRKLSLIHTRRYLRSLVLTYCCARAEAAAPIEKKNCDTSTAPSPHQVVTGDTLGGIAQRYGLHPIWGEAGSVVRLSEANHLKSMHQIRPGELIVLSSPCAPITNETVNETDRIPSESPPPDTTAGESAAEILYDDSAISLGVNSGFLVIDSRDNATGGEANLISNPVLGFDLEYRTHWSPLFTTSLGYRFERVQMRNSSNGQLGQLQNSLSRFSLGLHYRITGTGSLAFVSSYGESSFAQADSSGAVVLDRLLTPAFALEYHQGLLAKSKTRLELFAGYRRRLGTSYRDNSIQAGSDYYAGPALFRTFAHQVLEFKFVYSASTQDSDRFNQRNSSISGGVWIHWELK